MISIRGHAVCLVALIVGALWFGLSGNGQCGPAWASAASCAHETAGAMYGSVLLLVAAGLTAIGLGVRMARSTPTPDRGPSWT